MRMLRSIITQFIVDVLQIQWMAPLVGTAFFGAGQVLNFMVINTYLVDTFTPVSYTHLTLPTKRIV